MEEVKMHRTQPGLRAVNLRKVRLLDRIAVQEPKLASDIRSLKLNWFKMRNVDAGIDDGGDTPDPGSAEIFIYDEIGGSFGVGVQDFIDELNEIQSPQITVRINSPGGMLVDAIAISSALNQHPSQITTRVDGIAASAASVIAIAGDRLEMMPGSQLMIHDVLVDFTGNAADMRETIDWLNNQSQNVAQMYANKAGGDPDEFRALMLAETWMFAEESVTSGLADAVYVRPKQTSGTPPFPPKKDDEPDGDEPEKPDEEEPDEKNDEEDDDDEEMSNALAVMMNRKHRLTNRGFKYLGREKAPAPALPTNSLADLLDMWR
jgi:ATP-dependent protease ClpP protease subunit